MLVDDDELMRTGLRAVLSSDERLELVARPTTAARRSTGPATPGPTWC
jgi:DNA-binding NarL/FixJ family response regulator